MRTTRAWVRIAVTGALTASMALLAIPQAGAVEGLPAGFHWGVTTSGYQSEGDPPDSNWSRYDDSKEPYLNSVDFRHRYPEDIANAAAMGVNTFRFGVEWARVQPRRGVWDEAELEYYDDVVRRIREAGMTPMITLDHWVYPGWVADQGAWDNPQTVQDWLTNARKVVDRFSGLGAMWITFNETTPYFTQEIQNRRMSPDQIALMQQHLVQTHRAAYDLIHELDPGAMVSSNVAYIPGAKRLFDATFIDQVTDKLDFFGIDYYYGASPENMTAVNGLTGEFWKIDYQPEGMLYALRYYHDRFPDLPLYVVENGMATDNGAPREDGYTRSDHLRDHVHYVQRAVAEGIPVIGYNYWPITDNYEWGSYRPRFGLYTVDAATDPALTRRPTDAVATYRQIIADGGVAANYVPVKAPERCVFDGLPESCLAAPGG